VKGSGETDANSTAAAKANVLWKLPLKRCALMKLLKASLEATANKEVEALLTSWRRKS
jgi:hypothetical protein